METTSVETPGFRPDVAPGAIAIEANDLHKHFGPVEVLKGIDLEITEGEVVVIVGRSGSGKSTLLRCLNLLERPTSGTIRVLGEEITSGRVSLSRLRRKIGMVFQHFELFPHRTAIENVMAGPYIVLGTTKAEARVIASDLLDKVGLSHRAEQYPNQLSGGEKQRVAIARALALNPKIMLFDEPTSSLDPELKGEVLDTMRELAYEGMTMVVVTHEMIFARRVANRAIFIDQGVVVEHGPPEQVLRTPATEPLKRFLNVLLWGEDS